MFMEAGFIPRAEREKPLARLGPELNSYLEKCSGALSAFDCDSTERMVDIHGSDGN